MRIAKLFACLAVSLLTVTTQADPFRIGAPHLDPPPGFPADSFFDVFVEIDLPMFGPGSDPFHGIGTGIFRRGSDVIPVNGPVVVGPLVPHPGTGTFDTEMLAMDLTGAGFMVRESPTKASTGKVTPIPGGGFDSFFDVFVELSFDGGQSWVPYQQSLTTPDGGGTGALLALSFGALALLRKKRGV